MGAQSRTIRPTRDCQRAVCPGLGLLKGEIGAGTVSGVRCVRLGAQTDRDGVLLAEVPYEGVAKARPFSSVMTAALARPATLLINSSGFGDC